VWCRAAASGTLPLGKRRRVDGAVCGGLGQLTPFAMAVDASVAGLNRWS